ncbi:beta-RFAP synthase [Aeoliella mucimassa]|uniref:GHMP kinase C-terminal domain-containing protein n=1 Tax=Aeoliella mucimassa TaxID=2527972 RepID=A0A518AKD2_9BACT|nr:beta-RFAP synthase [Aeoliella mucimassa]QDU55134.1 hypothetical protein Pan181_13200 [Aeoliella mucimassa]
MSNPQSIELRTAARLHFGLWAWGPMHPRQFGGVGLMIEQPKLTVRATGASQFEARGAFASRMLAVAERCRTAWRLNSLPTCVLEVVESPPTHAGFGVGTQLSLAVAQLLSAWSDPLERHTAKLMPGEELARAAKRGRRSAIGTHGFCRGGLLVDAGKAADEPLGQLETRVEFPEPWRVVLLTPDNQQGKAGKEEQSAFAKLPAVPMATTHQLQQIARERIVPACQQGDFNEFATAVYEYGHLAGLCFAEVQGGAYSSDRIAEMVAALRERGVAGVGQSSWGPTLFAMQPSQAAAEKLVAELRSDTTANRCTITITPARNRGAELVVDPV